MQANSTTHFADENSEGVFRNRLAQPLASLAWPAVGVLSVRDHALDVHMRRWVRASQSAQQELPL